MPHPDDERRSFLTPIFFATAIAGWMAVPAFIWTKDILLVGPGARSFSATEVLLTLQSMVVWGIFTPFIFSAARCTQPVVLFRRLPGAPGVRCSSQTSRPDGSGAGLARPPAFVYF